MDIDKYISGIGRLIVDNPILACIVLVAFLLVAYKKPGPVFKTAILVLFALAMFYVATMVQDAVFSGIDNKDQIIDKQETY